MANRQVDIFRDLQRRILARLTEVRGSIAPAYADMSVETAQHDFELVLREMQRFLDSGNAEAYRNFLQRWMALRTGNGDSPEGTIHTMVAIGDVVVQVARHTIPAEDPGISEFLRQVVQLNRFAARVVVDVLGEEWEECKEKVEALF